VVVFRGSGDGACGSNSEFHIRPTKCKETGVVCVCVCGGGGGGVCVYVFMFKGGDSVLSLCLPFSI